MSLLWVNGTLVDKADARVSPFDHGFLYGDGVWEPLRVFGGRLFRGADHIDRLFAVAEHYELDVPYTAAELLAAVEATVRANHRTDGYCRVIVTRGPGTIGPDPRKLDPQVFITAEEYYPFPSELAGHGLHVVTYPHPVAAAGPRFWLQALGRPDIVSARRHALRAGCLDAVICGPGEGVIGTTEGDLFFARGGTVSPVPPTTTVEARAVAELARDLGPWKLEPPPTPSDLNTADEVFLVGTACGVIGVVRIDGHTIGNGTEGPVTRAVREAYHALTRGADTMPAEGGAP
ncbi:aminotransferase class IV [Urbifossiella limnaea]|uniref:branched-chain-amino-acid transaminase n=1 Tax=Urbifossiella limnaea TaxID=2528023 RepID=A0A517XRL3_9BACT|nr:aminotransferase class IV [Urbifossiella limnaea]QDU20147.1 Branched-chain-amino-acid aminotransferase [Urbifossiella limnaea]